MTSRRRVFVIALVVLVAAGGAFVTWRWLDGPDSRLAAAVALAPEDSQRFSWTDWSAARDELDADLSGASTVEDLAAFLDEGYDADLTSTSSLLTVAPTLHDRYGVSPANLDWELLAQAPDGQVALLGLPAGSDLDELRSTLRELGYQEPEDPDGTWSASEAVLADLGGMAIELAHLQIDDDERIIVASDDPAYLAGWRGSRRGAADDGIGDVVAAYDDAAAVSAVVYSGDHACGALAMGQADGADAARADQLIEDAGEVHPMRGFAMASLPGGEVRVAMAFETDDHARTDADSRAVLAAGPAPGQGGDFSDRFTLGEVSADGRVVRMELEPVPGAYVLSDLSTGPVLFATC